jgi:hypothetical protein
VSRNTNGSLCSLDLAKTKLLVFFVYCKKIEYDWKEYEL